MKKVLEMTVIIWMLIAVMLAPVNVMASDTTVMGTILKTNVDVTVYQDTSETSAIAAVLESGTVVLVTEVDEEGWSRITTQEITGYIKTEYLSSLGSSDEIDREFEQIGNNYHMIFNELQQIEKQRLQTKVWGIVIALLAIGIFAAGIIPVIKKNKEDEKDRIRTETKQ